MLVLLFLIVVACGNVNASEMPAQKYFNEIIVDSEYHNDLLIKDGKWKERWQKFLEGFLEGFKDGVGGINNSGSGDTTSSGFTKEDFNYIFKYAKKNVGSLDAAISLTYEAEQLIHNESSVITNAQMLRVFNGNEKLLDIIKKGMTNSTFPKKENMKKSLVKSKRGVLESKKVNKIEENIAKRFNGKDVFLDKEKSPGRFWKVLGYVVGWIAGNFVKG